MKIVKAKWREKDQIDPRFFCCESIIKAFENRNNDIFEVDIDRVHIVKNYPCKFCLKPYPEYKAFPVITMNGVPFDRLVHLIDATVWIEDEGV